MFSKVRIVSLVHTTIFWGAISVAIATVPLIALLLFGALDSIAAQYLRGLETGSYFLALSGQIAAFFPGAVMGFWVGLTREVMRARVREDGSANHSLRS
jgi:hypothetical protein